MTKTEWKIDDKPVKVDKWDGAAVKNALDDAVKKIFKEKFKYRENHKLMDGRLIFSTIAVTAAMFALLWDIFHPFPESQPVLIICVVSYFILMAVLTAYTTFLEQGIFLVSMEKDVAGIDPDHKWTARSCLKRFDDYYNLLVTYTDGRTKQTKESKLAKSVSCWFDENGTLLYDLFEPDVCKLHNDLANDKKQK